MNCADACNASSCRYYASAGKIFQQVVCRVVLGTGSGLWCKGAIPRTRWRMRRGTDNRSRNGLTVIKFAVNSESAGLIGATETADMNTICGAEGGSTSWAGRRVEPTRAVMVKGFW